MDGCMFCDKHSEKCRTHSFEIGDYVMYRGERFEINYDPTALKRRQEKLREKRLSMIT